MLGLLIEVATATAEITEAAIKKGVTVAADVVEVAEDVTEPLKDVVRETKETIKDILD